MDVYPLIRHRGGGVDVITLMLVTYNTVCCVRIFFTLVFINANVITHKEMWC